MQRLVGVAAGTVCTGTETLIYAVRRGGRAERDPVSMGERAVFGTVWTDWRTDLAAHPCAFALLLIASIAVAMAAQSLLLRRGSFQVISGRSRPARVVELGKWTAPALLFCGVAFIVSLVLPLVGAFISATMIAVVNGFAASNFTSQNFSDALAVGSANVAALQRSVVIALICASVVSLVALPLAYSMERGEAMSRRALNLVTLSTIAVPGIVLAAGYIFAWNQPWESRVGLQLYGTLTLLVMALIAGALPYAVRLYAGSMAQIHGSMIDAARVQGAGDWTALLRIVRSCANRSRPFGCWCLRVRCSSWPPRSFSIPPVNRRCR